MGELPYGLDARLFRRRQLRRPRKLEPLPMPAGTIQNGYFFDWKTAEIVSRASMRPDGRMSKAEADYIKQNPPRKVTR